MNIKGFLKLTGVAGEFLQIYQLTATYWMNIELSNNFFYSLESTFCSLFYESALLEMFQRFSEKKLQTLFYSIDIETFNMHRTTFKVPPPSLSGQI